MHLWVSESPSSHSSSLSGPGVHSSQSPWNSPGPMCHALLDHSVPEAGAQGGTHPSVGLCLQEWAPIHVGSKPLHLPGGSHELSHHVGSRARGPERPKAKRPERQLAPNSKAMYQESDFSVPSACTKRAPVREREPFCAFALKRPFRKSTCTGSQWVPSFSYSVQCPPFLSVP